VPKLAGVAKFSDVTLLNRLRQSESWLRELCQQLWKENGVDLTPAIAGFPVRLVDGSVVKEPGKTGSQWRLHYSLRLPSLECDEFILTPAHGQGNGDRLARFHFRRGELILADAGTAIAWSGGGSPERCSICMRLNPHTLPCLINQDALGTAGPAADAVATGAIGAMAGLGAIWQASFAGRVCAIRKSEDAIARAQAED